MKTEEGLENLQYYCSRIKKYGGITNDEQNVLIEKAQKGDKEAMAKAIENNLSLVIYYAKNWFNHPEYEYMDIIAMGNIGLCKAIMKYDMTKGLAFSTYAKWCIIGEIAYKIKIDKNKYGTDSLEKIVGTFADGEPILLKDTLMGEKDITTEQQDKTDDYVKVVREALDELDDLNWGK